MTIPPMERTENVRLAFAQLLERVSDEAVDGVLFDTSEFSEILSTTWEDLKANGFVEVLPAGALLCMTGRGWVAGLFATEPSRSRNFPSARGRITSRS